MSEEILIGTRILFERGSGIRPSRELYKSGNEGRTWAICIQDFVLTYCECRMKRFVKSHCHAISTFECHTRPLWYNLLNLVCINTRIWHTSSQQITEEMAVALTKRPRDPGCLYSLLLYRLEIVRWVLLYRYCRSSLLSKFQSPPSPIVGSCFHLSASQTDSLRRYTTLLWSKFMCI